MIPGASHASRRRLGRRNADRGREERPLGRRGPGHEHHTPGPCWRPRTSTVDALFDQAGVDPRPSSLAELLDVASLLANQPLPAGPRVGIVTNAGGPGIMCADACEACGSRGSRDPARLSETGCAELLPAEAGLRNPVDMIATATAEHYRTAIAHAQRRGTGSTR